MVSYNRAIALYAEKNRVIFAYNNYRAECPRRRLRLMRQHNLQQIFQEENLYQVQSIFFHRNNKRNGKRILLPIFRHPHDVWVRKHTLLETYEGQVVTVSHSLKGDHLLVELAPNVLAFAECEKFDGKQKVNFVPYKYNRRTKRIYGYLE